MRLSKTFLPLLLSLLLVMSGITDSFDETVICEQGDDITQIVIVIIVFFIAIIVIVEIITSIFSPIEGG